MSSVSLFLPFSLTKIFWNFRYLSVICFFHCLPSGSMTDLQLSPFRPSIHSSTLIIWYTVIPFYCHHHWLCTFPWMQGDLRHAEESSTSQVCIVTTATNPQTQRTTIIASDSSQVSKIRGVVEAMDKISYPRNPADNDAIDDVAQTSNFRGQALMKFAHQGSLELRGNSSHGGGWFKAMSALPQKVMM